MARRDNRRANREAAKAMLETPQVDKKDLKAQQEEQMEFFKAADIGLDMGGDEDDDMNGNDDGDDNNENENANTNSEAEEGVAKTTSAPNVESGDEEVEDGEDGGEDEGDDGDGEEVAAKAGEPSTEAGKPEASKLEAEKPTAPAPEAKKEEVKPEQQTEPKTLSNEEAAQLFSEWRSQTEELLATHHYRMDEKQVAELNENPAAYIPKAMARVYMDAVSAAFQQFTNYLPRMVNSVLQQRETMNTTEKTFFDRWPDLVNHRDTVIRLGQSYRAANPSASMEDFINEVGAQATVALRLSPANGNANGNGNAPAGKPADNRKPFKPATELPAAQPPKRTSDNPFEQLAGEFLSEMEEDIGD